MTLTIDDTVTHLAVDQRLDQVPMFASLSPGTRRVLFTLAHARRVGYEPALSEVAKRVGLSRAALTTLADRLERDGLAQRVRDDSDRRRILFTITDAGFDGLVDALDRGSVAA